MEEEARLAAIYRVQELLKHPDDIVNKLGPLRKKFSAERASIEAQLRTAVESQLQDAQRGLDVLAQSQEATRQTKSNLSLIDNLWSGSNNTIKNYARIKKISRTHQNFLATKELVDQFQRLNSQVARIQKIVLEDSKVPDGPADNLLYIHHQLQQLENFRNTSMSKAQKSSGDILSTLQIYFRQVDDLVDSFEKYLWIIARNTMELIKKDRAYAVIRLVKIIETEERADEQASLAEVSSLFDFMPTSSREIKSFRIKFFDVLRETIVAQINGLHETYKSDLPQLFSKAEAIVDDLIMVHDELEPRFPKKYNIFQFFVLEYHRAIYDVVNSIISGPLEAGSILLILRWVRDYYASMSGRLGVGEELLEPRLLDDREDELILQYIKLVRQKLGEWLNNLLNTETRDFLERTGPPEMDVNGMYLLSGSVIVFQMFNQQVDVVSSSSRGALIYDVIVECCNALEEFQKAWTRILEHEYQKFLEKPADVAEGLPEYIIALANDSLRSTEFSETISARIEPMIDDPFKTQALLRIKGALDGFMRVAKRSYGIVIDIVLKDILPALVRFYCTEWYEMDLMRLVIGTLEDYCTDFQEHTQEYIFSKFTSELQDRLLLLFLEALRNKGAKFKMPVAVEKMKVDLELAIEFFSRYKAPKRVKAAFEIMEKIIGFIESNPRLLFLDFYALWKSYPDVPLGFVEELLQKRDDLERAEIREIMEQCRTKVIEEKEKNSGKEWPQSLFSKLSLK
ncbi:SNARE-binding exocyst subunit S6 [Chytridiales sp. JEL 0842]|nr:SNARE-binding exocyst subunit S6 [Chytridiales sp. JEL 0842]